jgi:SagB-type dehydrogenase family enzyme
MLKQDIDYLSYSLTDIFDQDDDEFTETFHEFTKLTPTSVIEISKRVNQITSDVGLMSMMSRSWKKYAAAERIAFDKSAPLGEMSLAETLRRRASLSSYATEFAPGPVSFEQLGAILQYSYGATRHMPAKAKNMEGVYLRSAISAGGLYPLEIYPIVFDVDGLQPGLYHYYMPDHALHRLRSGSLMDEVLTTTTYVDLVKNASVLFVVTGVWARTIAKYRQRGYRFMMNDTGALLQNLYLTGTSFDLGTCALGGFYDDRMARLLGVNPLDEPVIIGFLLGRKPQPMHGRG